MPRQRRARTRRRRSARSRRSRNRVRRISFRRRRTLTRGQKPYAHLGYLLPKRCAMRTVYSSPVATMNTVATQDEWTWNASSVYDPDVTNVVTGHQPMLYDNMMALYSRWIVKSAAFKINIIQNTTNNVTGGQGNIYVTANNNILPLVPTAIERVREQPKIYSGVWGYLGDRSQKLVHWVRVNNAAIIPEWSRKNPDCYGVVNAGPALNNYVHIIVSSANDSANLIGQWRITAYYDVEFSVIDELLVGS